MTREEAIEIFKDWIDEGVEYDDGYAVRKLCEEEEQAVIMAIQALSQEPTEKAMTVDEMEREYEKSKALFHKIVECDDAISREAVLSKIKEVCFSEEWTQFRLDKGSNGQRDFIIDYIEQLPSVTQKPGKWIYKNLKGQYCSVCDEQSVWKFKYCPNCGAKMVEPQERSDKE